MTNTQKGTRIGWSSGALLLCAGAAGSVSLQTALLTIGMVALTLCLLQLVQQGLSKLRPDGCYIAMLWLAATLAAVYQLAFAEWRLDWLNSFPSVALFYWAILLCAPVAVDSRRGKPMPTLALWMGALAWLVIGAVRELLSKGQLGGVKLFSATLPFVSPDWALGAGGLVIAGLLLACFGLAVRQSCRYTIRQSWWAALIILALTIAGGYSIAGLSVWLKSLDDIYFLPMAAVPVGILAGIGYLVIPHPVCKQCFQDPLILTVASLFAYLVGRNALENGFIWPLFTGLMTAATLIIVIPLATKFHTLKLPKPFDSTPALLIGAGLVLYAFSILM